LLCMTCVHSGEGSVVSINKAKKSRIYGLIPLVLVGLLVSGSVIFLQSWVSTRNSRNALQRFYAEVNLRDMRLMRQEWLRRDSLDDIWHWEYEYTTNISRELAYRVFKQAITQADLVVENNDPNFLTLSARSLTKNVYVNISFEPHPGLTPIPDFETFKNNAPKKILVRTEVLN
jgi:hypothetical protein